MTSNSILPASAVDRRLLRGAAKYLSANELSEYVHGQLSPAEAQNRVVELLESKTILDEILERRLVLIRMSEHLDWIQEQRHDPKSWGAIAKQFKLVSDQIERANVTLSDVSSKLASEQAGYFVEGFVVGFDMILKRLMENREIEIEEEEIIELMQVGTAASQEYVERVTIPAEVEA